jgi:hypothetical protein
MYQATICKLTDIQYHPNADRLRIAKALGYSIVIGLTEDTETLGVVFPSDGVLSVEMLLQNNLYRKHPVTGEPMGGYIEESGRVKSLRLRGAVSDALWLPVSSLAWTGVNLSSLKEGFQFTELNGKLICEKYYTPATRKAMGTSGGKVNAAKKIYVDFPEHIDTGQLRDRVTFIQGREPEYNVIITLKVHGTSGRTGNLLWKKRTKWQNFLAKFRLYKDKYRVVSGTRRVILDPDKTVNDGYYKGTDFRETVHNMISGLGLRENEILYYEIAGWSGKDSLIMAEHGINAATMKESGIPSSEYGGYGDTMRYTYGCEPGEFRVFVYRIVQDGQDLSFWDMEKRVKELQAENKTEIRFDIVPFLLETTTNDDLMKISEELTRGKDPLGEHIREGVVLRLEDKTGKLIFIVKYKGFLFCVLEGIRKNTDGYVDTEEIA